MFKKIFGRRTPTVSATERVDTDVRHVYTADRDGLCPRCGGQLERRSCLLLLGNMEDEKIVDTDIGRFCCACPTMVLDTKDVAKLAKSEKMKGALPVAILRSESDEPVEFETFDGEPLSDMENASQDMLSMFAKMMGVDPALLSAMQEGPESTEAPRRTMSSAERQKKRNKRKQASKARKQNRKRK